MNTQKEHRVTIKIDGVDAFRLPLREDEESFYHEVVEKINAYVKRFAYGANADTKSVALAKVTLYYAVMYYRQSNLINNQAKFLQDFENSLDGLLAGVE